MPAITCISFHVNFHIHIEEEEKTHLLWVGAGGGEVQPVIRWQLNP